MKAHLTVPSFIVAPSLLAGDLTNLEKELHSVEESGADWHHVDVMDGHFVPNLTFGLPMVQALKKKAGLPLDVHIMISNPDIMALRYVEAGADRLSFHYEATVHAHRLLIAIKEAGAQAGLAINPGTSVELIKPLLTVCDQITIMSVNPGFSGQSYIRGSETKIAQLREVIEQKNLPCLLIVDGGINEKTVDIVRNTGAHGVVAGNYFFSSLDQDERKQRVARLKSKRP